MLDRKNYLVSLYMGPIVSSVCKLRGAFGKKCKLIKNFYIVNAI